MKRILSILLLLAPVAHGQIVTPAFHGSFVKISGAAGCAYSDADAMTYINAVEAATGATIDTTHRCGLHRFAAEFKIGSVWSTKTAMYLPIWNNATADAINFRNPGTYDLTWNGGITRSATGITWNGSTGYANTGFSPALFPQNDICINYYFPTGVVDGTGKLAIGAYGPSSTSICQIEYKFGTTQGGRLAVNAMLGTYSNGTNLLGLCFASISAAGTFNLNRNCAGPSNLAQTSSTPTTNNFYVGAANNNGTAAFFSSSKTAYFSFGTGMSSTLMANECTAFSNLKTAFGL